MNSLGRPTVMVINGPNLNLLGQREPGIYGSKTLADVKADCEAACALHGLTLDFRQSNHEGVLVDWLQEAGAAEASGSLAGVVLNAAAYTHTSVALRDAIKGANLSTIELHISNVHAREEFRNHSYISAVAKAVMAGFGTAGYALAISAVAGWAKARTGQQG